MSTPRKLTVAACRSAAITEAEAVKIDPSNLAIVWRYTPSPHWDEWSESIPLKEMVSRGLVLKEGKTGEHYKVVQKEEAAAEAAAAAAAAAAPSLAASSADLSGADGSLMEDHSDEVDDFADIGVDAACSLQLEALAVSRTAGAYSFLSHDLRPRTKRDAYEDTKQSTQTCS